MLLDCKPDIVLVHGDTTTAFASSVAAFYMQIPVAHVEAGLRTHNIYSPFPEEYNRQAISLVAKYHFSPTQMARYNLRLEGRPSESIYVTGNTGIDALKTTVRPDFHSDIHRLGQGQPPAGDDGAPARKPRRADAQHVPRRSQDRGEVRRREARLSHSQKPDGAPDRLRNAVTNSAQIKLIEPMEVDEFHNLINAAYLILTDSGGISGRSAVAGQARARDARYHRAPRRAWTPARCAWSARTSRLSTTPAGSCWTIPKEYKKMSTARNPYGDGTASARIADIIEKTM